MLEKIFAALHVERRKFVFGTKLERSAELDGRFGESAGIVSSRL